MNTSSVSHVTKIKETFVNERHHIITAVSNKTHLIHLIKPLVTKMATWKMLVTTSDETDHVNYASLIFTYDVLLVI